MLAYVSLRKWRILALAIEILSCLHFTFRLDFHDICSSITCWLDFLNYCWQATSKRGLNICQIPIQNCSLTCKSLMTQKPTRIRWVNGPLANNLPLFPWRIEVVRELLSEMGQDSGYIVDERWTMLTIPSCRFQPCLVSIHEWLPLFLWYLSGSPWKPWTRPSPPIHLINLSSVKLLPIEGNLTNPIYL